MSAPVDIRGQKFGELIAIEPTDKRRGSYIIWRCRCSCGKEVFATAKHLRSGNTKSCGHVRRSNITGQRFGRLTAIEPTDRVVRNNVVWRCICDCGKEAFVAVKDLRSGNTKSCGCLNLERHSVPPDVVEGTRISTLGDKPPKSNTSGVRGVSWSKQKQDWGISRISRTPPKPAHAQKKTCFPLPLKVGMCSRLKTNRYHQQ